MDRLTIGEVCALLRVKPHVLRYWEQELELLSPEKDLSGRRSYSSHDLQILARIKHLVQDRKFTLDGARQKMYQELLGPDENRNADRKARIHAIRQELFGAARRAATQTGRRRSVSETNRTPSPEGPPVPPVDEAAVADELRRVRERAVEAPDEEDIRFDWTLAGAFGDLRRAVGTEAAGADAAGSIQRPVPVIVPGPSRSRALVREPVMSSGASQGLGLSAFPEPAVHTPVPPRCEGTLFVVSVPCDIDAFDFGAAQEKAAANVAAAVEKAAAMVEPAASGGVPRVLLFRVGGPDDPACAPPIADRTAGAPAAHETAEVPVASRAAAGPGTAPSAAYETDTLPVTAPATAPAIAPDAATATPAAEIPVTLPGAVSVSPTLVAFLVLQQPEWRAALVSSGVTNIVFVPFYNPEAVADAAALVSHHTRRRGDLTVACIRQKKRQGWFHPTGLFAASMDFITEAAAGLPSVKGKVGNVDILGGAA